MTTTTTNLNLRPEASTNTTPLLVIPKGADVAVGPVSANGTTWYPVTYDGRQGWVSGKYLDMGETTPPTDTQTPYDDYVADAMAYAKTLLGLWYRWGGNFTQEPFSAKRGDCSGYVGWVSETMGYRPGNNALYNYTADSMFDNFRNGVWAAQEIDPANAKPMDIVFYGGSPTNAGHVVFAVGDGRVIGASGGYPGTTTDAQAKAIKPPACVRYDDLHYHDNPIVGIFRPDYGAGR